jgi:hypothetical protein
MDGMVLTNKNQKKIVKVFHSKIQEHIDNAPDTDISCTFVPYYDSILDENKKSNLGEIAMSPLIVDKVRNQSLKGYFKSDLKTN